MQPEKIAKVFRVLNQISDNDLSALALGGKHFSIPTVDLVEHRYSGNKKVPGMPMGMEQYAPGKYRLRHIALVRVPTDEHIGHARKIVRDHTKKIATVCVGAAIAGSVLTAFIWSSLLGRSETFIIPPCVITRILPDAVFCRTDKGEAGVDIGQAFDDGRYRLDAILSGQSGFAATRLKDQRSVVFQADPKFYLQPSRR